MAEGEFWQDTKRRRRQQRIEPLVASLVGGMLAEAGAKGLSVTKPSLISEAFAWAGAIMEESDRREDEAAP